MASLPSLLNSRQLEVLNWINDGCPDGVMPDHSYKIVAVALQNRKLVTISKRGGLWEASLTEDGSYYLESREDASPAKVKPKRRSATAATAGISTRPAKVAQSNPSSVEPLGPARTKKLVTKRSSPTDLMLAELLASGGELRVASNRTASYEARVAAAIRFGKVPKGKQLVTSGRWSSEFVIRLQDAPDWLTAPMHRIVIPNSLRKPHPVVRSLRSRDSILRLDRATTHRALLLIQALVSEAERRGYTVKETKVSRDGYGYRHVESKDHFSIVVMGHGVGIKLRQIMDRVPHEPTATELADKARYEWTRIPKYDSVARARLSLHLSGYYEHRQSKWADTALRSLEDSLPQILQEIELRGEVAARDRLEKIQAAEERQRQWEIAMEEAKEQYCEFYCRQTLERQANNWVRSREIREYLDALRSAITSMTDPDEAAAALEWLGWCEKCRLHLDPLSGHLGMPQVPPPKEEDLKPFLNGLSPWGPSY